MKKICLVITSFFVLCLAACPSCSDKNAATSYTDLTDDEKARQALNDEDFPKAIELYKALVEKYPEDYERYPLLATAYAANAGVSVLSILKGSLGGGEEEEEEEEDEGGGSVFDSLDSTVPTDPSDDALSDIQLAVDTLQEVPEERLGEDGGYAYSASSALLLDIYLAASSTMHLNKFREVGADGQIDQDKLEEMSDEEVDVILGNLQAIADAEGSDLAGSVEETLEAIDAQEGETSRERLINYIISKQ
jgi:hypothetical protein